MSSSHAQQKQQQQQQLLSENGTPQSSRSSSFIGSHASRFSEAVSSKGLHALKDKLTRPSASTSRNVSSASFATDVSAHEIGSPSTLQQQQPRNGLITREYPDMEAGFADAETEGEKRGQQQQQTTTTTTTTTVSSPQQQWRQKISGTLDSTDLLHRLDKDRRPRVVLFVIMNAILAVFLLCVALTWLGMSIVKKHRTYAIPQARSQGSMAQSLQN